MKLKIIRDEREIKKRFVDMEIREMFYNRNDDLCMKINRVDNEDVWNAVNLVTGHKLDYIDEYVMAVATISHRKMIEGEE
jgi:hypothetical protein